MNLSIEINGNDNEAFKNGALFEIRNALERIIYLIEFEMISPPYESKIYDTNGNACGTISLTAREEEQA